MVFVAHDTHGKMPQEGPAGYLASVFDFHDGSHLKLFWAVCTAISRGLPGGIGSAGLSGLP